MVWIYKTDKSCIKFVDLHDRAKQKVGVAGIRTQLFTFSQLPNALSSESISPGSIPIGLSTQVTGGQYNAQFAGLPLASSNVGIGTAATPPSSTQYTNTTQASSSGGTPIIKHRFMLLNYKFFALFSSLYLLSIYRVVSYD